MLVMMYENSNRHYIVEISVINKYKLSQNLVKFLYASDVAAIFVLVYRHLILFWVIMHLVPLLCVVIAF